MTGIFFIYHLGALFANETNIETLFKNHFVNRYLSYDLGAVDNFKQVFGGDWRLWLFPVFTTKGKVIRIFIFSKWELLKNKKKKKKKQII